MDLQSYTADSVDSYYAPTTHRSGKVNTPDQIINGMEFYNNGKYNEAIEQFEQLNIDNQSTMQSNFLHAMANMKIFNYTEAIKYFDIVYRHDDNSFTEDATYFMGLCYINTKEDEKARAKMEGILSTKSRYKKEAKKILKNID
jgi:tetratricopeptide (TPR) repeat protein